MAAKSELPALLYKIVDAQPPSPIPFELPLSALDAKDGFMHLSMAHQVAVTADKFFARSERLWLLKIGTAAAQEGSARLVWENRFWHLYEGRLGEGIVLDVKEYGKPEDESLKWADIFAQSQWLVDHE
ncbi:hypothetical protein FIBSPDRAFT_849401 [Athelia psychrophila]|uniref:DUF952-domain-containing protein n=1 Tax=Athelia psychrophila TaxID=1759441 RepID=A0A166U8M6_9AGAM|nr:hypothetical protein FIBSPDRAFT_849401 [Fibularhizoctonia sp. CBS 109695]